MKGLKGLAGSKPSEEVVEESETDGVISIEERSLGGGAQNYYDGTGFFNYNDIYDWSDAAIYAQSCYES